ncbi:MAG: hypothetical protein JWM74_2701, partial [Myxococcaceae bacterium]|nr:hypothetical protein [Myxococcaceae bacterium]
TALVVFLLPFFGSDARVLMRDPEEN